MNDRKSEKLSLYTAEPVDSLAVEFTMFGSDHGSKLLVHYLGSWTHATRHRKDKW